MRKAIYILGLLILSNFCFAQNNEEEISNPKLVVGIVVDQMRYDYLTRFYNKYGEGGFKRMINEGFNCKNNHFNYIPTYTGPGHASVYTGTTPKTHGIISNDWYDKEAKKEVYCTGDDTVQSVGTSGVAGQMSPHRLKTTTFADENRLFTQMRGKTIGISIKDRGAILPAGHTANAAYWFQGNDEGHWVSSTFYMNELPQWVKDFNDSYIVESYFKIWDTLYDINTYTESGDDLNTFENTYNGKQTATFPYDLSILKDKNRNFEILKVSPFGNSFTTDFAIAAIDGEQLGQDNITDVFTISFSSTDYVGHYFGVNSKEIEDTYIRLDKDIERLLNALDTKVGKGEYTVFLTSDHGAVHVPNYLKTVNIPSGYFDDKFVETIETFMVNTYKSDSLLESISNNQLFFDYSVLNKLNINASKLEKELAHFVLQLPQVNNVFTRTELQKGDYTKGIAALIQNGFNQKRSGDVVIVMDPAVIAYGQKGSTHGSGLNYDTHVPLLFFGKGIKHGSTLTKTRIVDIAPTISALLGISFPNGATGKPLVEVLD